MQPSSAPQSNGCAPSTLLLQRRLCGRDCGKWRTVCRLSAEQRGRAEQLARLAFGIDPATEWRIVSDAPDAIIAAADGRAYVPLAEHERVRRKMVRFRAALHQIVAALDTLSDAEQHDVIADPPDWAQPTEPAPLGD